MRKIILSNKEILDICDRIGKELTLKFKSSAKPPIFIGVLNGGIPFLMDLVKYVDVPLIIDYIEVKSWSGLGPTGDVTLTRDLNSDIFNRDIVIVDDVVDSGRSMDLLIKYLSTKKPHSITTCSLLDKRCKREVDVKLDYTGGLVGDEFLMGYGLDYYDLFRNVNYVFVPDKEEIESWDKLR